MPVLMRVSGGGKKTKDATALPEDVRSGKIFYGKDGKQTGIWTPKVIDFTGDATATPGDVKKGKIFYNNKGKATGTLTSLETGAIFIDPKDFSDETVPCNIPYSEDTSLFVTDGEIICAGDYTASQTLANRIVQIPDLLFVYGVKVNNTIFRVPGVNIDKKNLCRIIVKKPDEYKYPDGVYVRREYFDFAIYNNALYFRNRGYKDGTVFEIIYVHGEYL